MSDVYVRAYVREGVPGRRYYGDLANQPESWQISPAALLKYWSSRESEGMLLVISDTPLGEKKKTFVMRRKEA